MESKTLTILEYNKIKEQLVHLAVCADTKEMARDLKPSCDVEKVSFMLRQTDEAFRFLIKKTGPPFAPVSPVAAGVKRAEMGSSLNTRELLNIAHVLRVARELHRYLDEPGLQEDFPLLAVQQGRITPLRALEQAIFDAIVSEEEIADTASAALYNIRRKMRSFENKAREALNGMIHSAKYQKCLQDQIVTMRGDRYVIPVKAEHKNEIPGIVHDASASGSTLFIEPMVSVEINNELRRLASEEQEEIEKILAELSAQVAEAGGQIAENYKAVLILDFYFAKARLAYQMNAVMPEINDRGITDIKAGRHPLLNSKMVVPTSIRLGADFDTLVITGPNTGGKTVALKTIGLFTLMTQAGLHIPADSGSKIAVFEQIFADIGDEQSIEQSLSTFSAHMVNIVSILKKANRKSLILFDELGAGTDPVEGAALAVSILEHTKAKGAKTVATTHYSEIKLYALSTDRVENAACEFDVETLRPTYKLLIGIPGKSNAFAISKRLGLADQVIDRARELITTENVQFEDIISDLETNRQSAEEARETAERYQREAQELKKQIEAERKKLNDQKQKMTDDARREAKKIVENAKRETEQIIGALRKAEKEAASAERERLFEESRRKLNKRKDALDDSLTDSFLKTNKPAAPPKELKLGNLVEITTLGQKGTVMTLPDKNGNLQVQAGILKITTHISALRLLSDESGEQVAKRFMKSTAVVQRTSQAKTEIDLRGQTLDEAEINVEKFIDDAHLAHLERVTIIHGKGTGTLRSGIHALLKRHKLVKSYRLGTFGEGETGVTIVEL